jgi:hypothetical protein
MILDLSLNVLHDDRSSITFAFLSTGTMVAILKHVGTADWDRERLNISINTPASWSAHALRMRLCWRLGRQHCEG